eukprot:scaffold118228_cov69-Phaeocystis_antarctica.AAC.4
MSQRLPPQPHRPRLPPQPLARRRLPLKLTHTGRRCVDTGEQTCRTVPTAASTCTSGHSTRPTRQGVPAAFAGCAPRPRACAPWCACRCVDQCRAVPQPPHTQLPHRATQIVTCMRRCVGRAGSSCYCCCAAEIDCPEAARTALRRPRTAGRHSSASGRSATRAEARRAERQKHGTSAVLAGCDVKTGQQRLVKCAIRPAARCGGRLTPSVRETHAVEGEAAALTAAAPSSRDGGGMPVGAGAGSGLLPIRPGGGVWHI